MHANANILEKGPILTRKKCYTANEETKNITFSHFTYICKIFRKKYKQDHISELFN